MIAPLLLAQAAPATAPVAGAVADEVVVIGRRLAEWRMRFTSTRRGQRCETKHSSGDIEIDAIGCAAMTACWPDAQPRYEATQARGVDGDTRKRMVKEADAALGACLYPKREAMIAALAEKRAAARTGAAQ